MKDKINCKNKLIRFSSPYLLFILSFVPIATINADEANGYPSQHNTENPYTDDNQQLNSNKQTIGEAPINDAGHDLSRLFLRDSEVLLNPSEIQLSIGFNYNTDENQRSFRKNRSRSLSIPFNISYGLRKKLEINASLPFQYNENEIISATNVIDGNKSGIGDVSLGMSYKLKTETKSSPSVTTSFNVTTPTGETSKPSDLTGLSTGSGFWGVSTGLSLTKSIDPAVLFFNVGYQHTFEDKQFGSDIQPGDSFNYGFGAGLSVNSQIAFSARISGSYQKETQLNNKQIRGTSSEPISLIGSVSYRLSNKTRLETTLNLGVSEDANDIGMGFTYIWSL